MDKIREGMYVLKADVEALGEAKWNSFRKLVEEKLGALNNKWGRFHCPDADFRCVKYVDDNMIWTHSMGEHLITAAEIEQMLKEGSEMKFTKADLRSGDILINAEGDIMQVFMGTEKYEGGVASGEQDWFPLRSYSDQVLFGSKQGAAQAARQIDAVYRPKSPMAFYIGRFDQGEIGVDYNLIFGRVKKTKEELDLEEVESTIAELQEKAKALRAAIAK